MTFFVELVNTRNMIFEYWDSLFSYVNVFGLLSFLQLPFR